MSNIEIQHLENLARWLRYQSLVSTAKAGSGHPSSCLSAADVMAGLVFSGVFCYDVQNPNLLNNDRLLFSKGHAAPLFYALWALAGAIPSEELSTLREFTSRLEGHPTMRFPYALAATGSLGQGLGISVGIALHAQSQHLPYRTYVLLGDSEMAEGSVWEAIQWAGFRRLGQLVAIVDFNRLGQRGETMWGHDPNVLRERVASFGWHVVTIDGHNMQDIVTTYQAVSEIQDQPVMIIARTFKGKGVSFMENQDNWHGKALKPDELERALSELGSVDLALRGTIAKPSSDEPRVAKSETATSISATPLPLGELIAPRAVYGDTLAELSDKHPNIVVLDAEVSNSTFANTFQTVYPDRFFEMYIAEQNMVSVASGLATAGTIPFVSSFAAFLTRAFDQFRMAKYSETNLKVIGTHCGVAIGEDGSSQMGLEDIAMFRSLGSVVLHPCDAVSAKHLIAHAAEHRGMVYVRLTRNALPVIYSAQDSFSIGGSRVLRKSSDDVATVVGCGVTVHEALAAYDELQRQGIAIRVIDAYSVAPLDVETLTNASNETSFILTVEDHVLSGGMGEAVCAALSEHSTPIVSLVVTKMPRSGKPEELLDYEGISRTAIVNAILARVRK